MTFGEQIGFHRLSQIKESEYVLSGKMSVGTVLEKYKKAKAESEAQSDSCPQIHSLNGYVDLVANPSCMLYHAASYVPVCSSCNNHQLPAACSGDAAKNSTCERAESLVPSALYNFLAWLMERDKGADPLTTTCNVSVSSPQVHCRVLSAAQDLLFLVSGGKLKHPKTVALSLVVKQLTGSKQTVQLLNRFGHVIAYSQLAEIETAMAEQQLQAVSADDVRIPSNISPHPGVIVTLCWDNNDINEETRTSAGKTQCTNGIVVQRKVQDCEPPPNPPRQRGNVMFSYLLETNQKKLELKRHSPQHKILPKPKKMDENSLITWFYHSRNYRAIYWSLINLSLLCRKARIAHAVQISWPRKSSVQLLFVQIVVVCSSSSNLTKNKLAAIGLYTRARPRRRVRLI